MGPTIGLGCLAINDSCDFRAIQAWVLGSKVAELKVDNLKDKRELVKGIISRRYDNVGGLEIQMES